MGKFEPLPRDSQRYPIKSGTWLGNDTSLHVIPAKAGIFNTPPSFPTQHTLVIPDPDRESHPPPSGHPEP